jgi:hypothetical protein
MALVQVSIELIAIYFHSLEIFNIQIGEMTFCKPDFIIIKSNYFQNAQKGQCFLDDFEALVGARSGRNLRSRLIVAFTKCHFEVSEFKKIFYAETQVKAFECTKNIFTHET